MMLSKMIPVLCFALFVHSAADRCCQTCDSSAGLEKYYSIDKVHNMCGECCMKPSQYPLYKIFEPGLTKAGTNTPCADNSFHIYNSTVTHGALGIKMTLDLFAPDADSLPMLPMLRSREYYHSAFAAWKKAHNKLFDAAEEETRLRAFSINDDIIERHNAQNSTFTLGHNEFSALSNEEFRALYTSPMPARAHSEKPRAIHEYKEGETLPASVDWTTKGAVTPVKNQGQCGSCWSFSTTGSMEGAYKIKTGTLKSFSEQQLVSCDKVDNGCNGGLMDNAFKWIKSNGGICEESAYPYTSSAGTVPACKTSCSAVSGTVPSYTDVKKNDEQSMMSAVAQQPVSIAIEADKSIFQLYKSGVLQGTCGSTLDHGVLAVGYGTLNGVDYWKVKNSWGTTWGQDGYILLMRGKKSILPFLPSEGECGLLSGPPSYPTL